MNLCLKGNYARENTQTFNIHMNQQSYSHYRMIDPLCTPFVWQLFKHIHSSQERVFPALQTGSRKSLRTQSTEPGCTGFYQAPDCSLPSPGLINTGRTGPAHWVTGLDVHALPCSWPCPNQYNHSSCQNRPDKSLKHPPQKRLSLWYHANSQFLKILIFNNSAGLTREWKVVLQTLGNPSMEDAPLGEKILDDKFEYSHWFKANSKHGASMPTHSKTLI